MKAPPKVSPLAAVVAGLALVAVWLYQRRSAAASGALTPSGTSGTPQYVFGDVGARVLNEDSRDEVVKALLADAERTRSRIAYEDASMSLSIKPMPIDDSDPYQNQWDTRYSKQIVRP